MSEIFSDCTQSRSGHFFAEVKVRLTDFFKGEMWLTKLFLCISSSTSSKFAQLCVSIEDPSVTLPLIKLNTDGCTSKRLKRG